jgi:antitoxin MazE
LPPPDQGRIIVEPILAETLDLAVLVAGITNENRHDAIEMGSAAGQEVW